MSTTAIFIVGVSVSLLCLGFLVFSILELKRLGKRADLRGNRE